MTASPAFALLECEGRYSPEPGQPPQSVVVKFGDASLVIMTFADVPITHWPLASLARERQGKRMILAPDTAAPERLEIDDATMIAAIAQVCRDAPGLRTPRTGLQRFGRWALGLVLAGGLASAVVMAAPTVLGLTAEHLPHAARARLGAASVLAHAAGRTCETPAGRRALDALAPLLTPEGMPTVRLTVADLPAGHAVAMAAPGGQILLTARHLASVQNPMALAQPVASAIAEAAERRRTALAMREAGVFVLPALVTGQLGHPRLVASVVADMRRTAPPSPAALAEAAGLAARMPALTGRGVRPLSGADWRAIRALCTGR